MTSDPFTGLLEDKKFMAEIKDLLNKSDNEITAHEYKQEIISSTVNGTANDIVPEMDNNVPYDQELENKDMNDYVEYVQGHQENK